LGFEKQKNIQEDLLLIASKWLLHRECCTGDMNAPRSIPKSQVTSRGGSDLLRVRGGIGCGIGAIGGDGGGAVGGVNGVS
jgi:hypothetical protein